MEKKIIAVALAVVLLAVGLTACSKGLIIEVDGGEYLAVTDEEGNTVLNRDGNIAVYVTDKHGKYVKDDNGERMTNAVDFPERVVSETLLETPIYKWVIPEGWSVTSRTVLEKSDTDGNVQIDVSDVDPNREYNFRYLVAKADVDSSAVVEEVKKSHPNTKLDIKDEKIFNNTTNARTYEIKIFDDEGKCFHYTKTFYFENGGTTYSIFYIAANGAYDENLDINTVIDGLTFKELAPTTRVNG